MNIFSFPNLLLSVYTLILGLLVIIVTGYQSVEMSQEALKNGAADYIPKPFDSKEIIKSIQKVI